MVLVEIGRVCSECVRVLYMQQHSLLLPLLLLLLFQGKHSYTSFSAATQFPFPDSRKAAAAAEQQLLLPFLPLSPFFVVVSSKATGAMHSLLCTSAKAGWGGERGEKEREERIVVRAAPLLP